MPRPKCPRTLCLTRSPTLTGTRFPYTTLFRFSQKKVAAVLHFNHVNPVNPVSKFQSRQAPIQETGRCNVNDVPSERSQIGRAHGRCPVKSRTLVAGPALYRPVKERGGCPPL